MNLRANEILSSEVLVLVMKDIYKKNGGRVKYE